MLDMRNTWKKAGLAISVVGILFATFVVFVAVAQAGPAIELGASARRGVPSGVLPPVDTRAEQALQTPSAASSAAASHIDTTSVWTIPSPAYKISIMADGIYQLSYSYLAAAGLPVDTLDPTTFRMFWMGQEIAIRVIGEENGKFDSGDVVLFYARSVDAMYFEGLTPINKYTGTNVYWLTYGGSPGLRMAVQDGSGAGASPDPFQHTEQLEFSMVQANSPTPTYFPGIPDLLDAEHWYRDWYQTGSSGVYSRNPYTFTAKYAASDPYKATFTARILGDRSVQHRMRFYLNGNLMLDDNTSGSGKTVFQTSTLVPQRYLVDGTNAIKVELVSPRDKIYLDWMKLVYYDRYVAESDRLAFSAPAPGAWRYSVTQFSTDKIEVYDVSDLIATQVVTPTTPSGSGPYTVTFGAASTGNGRYFALTSAARQTPASIEQVVPLASAYTPLDLLLPTQGADYIIITHRDFFDQALRLANHRASQFSRIKVIDVQSIYDQFNGGLMSAESIHDFLAYARATWVKPAPSYVVLMGDGSYDMRRYTLGAANVTYIPPYLVGVDPVKGETASDNRFVMLEGNDLVPDMHIGRLPVNTLAEARTMVNKIIAYEDEGCGCQSGGWRRNLLFVTDNLDTGGDFYESSDHFLYTDYPTNTVRSPLIPPTYTFTRAYLGRTCDFAGCQQMITNTLNTTGALFVSYVGHGNTDVWAGEGLLTLTVIDSLEPSACLPIMLPMTCLEGSFHEADSSISVLAESYTRAVDAATGVGKGAIAGFSPTGWGTVSAHDLLEEGLFQAVFHEGIDTLGAATTYAKRYLVDNDTYNSYEDVLDTFLLIGDPGLRIKTEAICEIPTGIVLAGFDVHRRGSGVRVSWRTNSEVKALSFNVLRAEGAGGRPAEADYAAVNPEPIFAQLSGSNYGASYFYDDAPVEVGQNQWYMLEITDLDGKRTLHGPVEVAALPLRVYLPQVGHAPSVN